MPGVMQVQHIARLGPAFRPAAPQVLNALLQHPDRRPVVLTNSLGDKVSRLLATLPLVAPIEVLGAPEGASSGEAMPAEPTPIPVPPPWGVRPLNFLRDIQPVFDRHCTGCHGGLKPAGGLDFCGGLTTGLRFKTLYGGELGLDGQRLGQPDHARFAGAVIGLPRLACQPASFYDELYATVEREGRWTGTTWSRRADGSLYREWRNVSAIRNDLGRITHLVILFFELDSRGAATASPLAHLAMRRH